MQVPFTHAKPPQHCPGPVHEYPRGTHVHCRWMQKFEQQSVLLRQLDHTPVGTQHLPERQA